MKKIFWKTLLALLLVLLMICGLLSGCNRNTDTENTITASDDTTSDGTVSLRVVTEKTGAFMMNDVVQKIAKDYEASHENVVIKVDILPDDAEEREIRLESLRADIMAGNGPDVFLLPTNTKSRREEMLFLDVVQSMYNGMFTDIGPYYDADDALEKEELQTTVMNAGVLGDARYVLPLRYSIDTLLIDREELAKYGVSEEEITGSINDLFEKILQKKDPMLAYSAAMYSINDTCPFPKLINYENEQVIVTEEEIAAFIKEYLQWDELGVIEEESYLDPKPRASTTSSYVSFSNYWQSGGFPIHVESLVDAVHSYVIAEAVGASGFAAYPLRSSDGSVVASVTYWGAIGTGCENVDVAYDFLRQFLCEETQWELGRSAKQAGAACSLYEAGYPVRIKGSIPSISASVVNTASLSVDSDDIKASEARMNALKAVEMTDKDFPLLEVEIDAVRFPISWETEFRFRRDALQLGSENGQPTDKEIEELAEEMIRELEFHLAEG